MNGVSTINDIFLNFEIDFESKNQIVFNILLECCHAGKVHLLTLLT
jgi:hypothetical protein